MPHWCLLPCLKFWKRIVFDQEIKRQSREIIIHRQHFVSSRESRNEMPYQMLRVWMLVASEQSKHGVMFQPNDYLPSRFTHNQMMNGFTAAWEINFTSVIASAFSVLVAVGCSLILRNAFRMTASSCLIVRTDFIALQECKDAPE